MTNELVREPEPKARSAVSPSDAVSLLECPLRQAFADDPERREEVPPSSAQVIGTAVHRLLEQAARGLTPDREAAEREWELALDEAIGGAAAIAEPPVSWPYFALKRAKAIRFAVEMGGKASAAPGRETKGLGSLDDAPLLERALTARGGRLRGRIDVVHPGPPKWIEDYKTGLVEDSQTHEPKRAYWLQMQLYAVLEHERDGVWPERARLTPLGGSPVDIEIDPDEADQTADEVLEALDRYQDAVTGGTVGELGRPAPETCRYCDFAVRCRAFWAACDESWRADGLYAAFGRITSTGGDGAFVAVTLDSTCGSVRGPVILRGVPSAAGPLLEGAVFGASGLMAADEGGEARVTSSTRFAVALGDTDG